MKIIKQGRKNGNRVFRFFCKCGCIWEAKEQEVTITLNTEDENNIEVICNCPCCGRIERGIGA